VPVDPGAFLMGRNAPKSLSGVLILFARWQGRPPCVLKLPWNQEPMSRDWLLMLHRNFHGKERQSRKAAAPPQKKASWFGLYFQLLGEFSPSYARAFQLLFFGIQARRVSNQHFLEQL
jgi:hypothetical protein